MAARRPPDTSSSRLKDYGPAVSLRAFSTDVHRLLTHGEDGPTGICLGGCSTLERSRAREEYPGAKASHSGS